MALFQKKANNVGNLGLKKVITTGSKKSSKQQQLSQSGHTEHQRQKVEQKLFIECTLKWVRPTFPIFPLLLLLD